MVFSIIFSAIAIALYVRILYGYLKDTYTLNTLFLDVILMMVAAIIAISSIAENVKW
jgi:hypothetical protein